MINVCIVEDEQSQVELLTEYLNRYALAHGVQFGITHMWDGMDIVDDYNGQFDIILLDIRMKHLDGMNAAEKLRRLDSEVVIIFITSTVQYAVQGYTVDALGYVLKPVLYTAFEQLIEKAVIRVEARQRHLYIKVNVDGRQIRLNCNSIIYIESRRNNVILHCETASYVTAGPLKKYEELLQDYSFVKCHNAYIVNLSAVEAVKKEEVFLTNGETLPISRARKKEFMMELTEGIL
ncbi:MAG: LytTR family DNA-binding domain-containing protein [Lachnospiraceae bacterium]|nr:LytTR family DNA-binding domain-containing protein [Lachnospiraceae bacterium]